MVSRKIGLFAGLCAAVTAGSLLQGCGKSGDAEAASTAGGDADTGAGTTERWATGGGERTPARPADADTPDTVTASGEPAGAGLDRLRQALAGAPVSSLITRSDRLEAARAWIAENADPEMSERQREFQAQMLALTEEMLDAEELSLAQGKAIMESQLLGLWGLDADGDGQITLEEARAGMESMAQMDATSPYFHDRFDTDGDGELSDAEESAAQQAIMDSTMPLVDSMIERASLLEWDADGDGFLSDDERTTGEATLEFNDWDGDGDVGDMERLAGYQSLIQTFTESLALIPQVDMQSEMMAESGRIMELYQDRPVRTDFDADGDGEVSDEEAAIFEQVTAEYNTVLAEEQQAIQQRMRDIVAEGIVKQHELAAAVLDQDGDSRLLDYEWEAGYERLRGERDARLFQTYYDTDGDGSVGDAEVARFMDLHEAGSELADANLDGRVDTGDLQYFMTTYSGQ